MQRYRIKQGTTVKLNELDPSDKSAFDGGKKERIAKGRELTAELEGLQELLYAEGKNKLLVVLQAMDTAGKDSTIRHVFDGVNPQGVKVAKFGKPTEEERAHDYLWRVHSQTPRAGEIAIFNRSHYEDVLVVRVHSLVPKSVWERRYDHINAFEELLHDEGTAILKFFLHIDLDEQKERLQERLDVPEKRWKFQKGDLAERKRWDDYMEAYEAAISRTSTDYAPWYVIPGNSKSYRNLVIASVITDRLKEMKMSYPDAEPELNGLVIT